ncbi:hypothetical protein ZWY2020_025030 [Hordeum vulgare]|nr:hypothetical protein ZWY2020_025030 [Hordeum vulgare]
MQGPRRQPDGEAAPVYGGAAEWDDVVANPIAEIPSVFIPVKKAWDGSENKDICGSNVSCSVVDEGVEIDSTDQFLLRLRPRVEKTEQKEEHYLDSSHSDYRDTKQVESVVTGPLLENAFIQQQTLSQSAIEHCTATRGGEVHRKREVLALARLKAAAERREIADQAKFDAAIAKIREEEEKIKLSAQRRKEELQAKKIAAEEKKKAQLEEKRIAAENKKKASEERKRKALEEKLAMADKRREAMEEKRHNTTTLLNSHR